VAEVAYGRPDRRLGAVDDDHVQSPTDRCIGCAQAHYAGADDDEVGVVGVVRGHRMTRHDGLSLRGLKTTVTLGARRSGPFAELFAWRLPDLRRGDRRVNAR
jgi:hypothetical protein